MAEPKKLAKPKAVNDVSHPGKSAPSDTSKSIITPRPIMKDPMMVNGDASPPDSKEPLPEKTGELKITPDADTPEQEAPEKPVEKAVEPETPAKPDSESDSEPAKSETPDAGNPADADKKSKAKKPDPDAEAAAQAEQDAKLQKIIDSKKYFLPINAIEQRRNARFVALGIILVIVLAVAWVDVALDAGLIHLGSVKALTHFFSN